MKPHKRQLEYLIPNGLEVLVHLYKILPSLYIAKGEPIPTREELQAEALDLYVDMLKRRYPAQGGTK